MFALAGAMCVNAADWAQWRGPQMNGCALKSPKLLNIWPENGPMKVWETADIPGEAKGGFGSISIFKGKAYLYVNRKFKASDSSPGEAKDVILCLNPKDGKVIWKKEYPGQSTTWGSSSTPYVVDGKLYVAGHTTLYCLKTSNGDEIWKSALKGGEISSSPIAADGVVAVLGGSFMGFEAATGKQLWSIDKINGNNPSPIVWNVKKKNYFICNSNGGINCVAPKTGDILWNVPGGGSATPTITGNTMVLLADDQKIGLVAYKISPEKADKIWNQPFRDRGCSPVVVNGYVYGFGGGKGFCVNLADGKIAWDQGFGGEISSPFAADNKVFGVVNESSIVMVKASPEKFEQLSLCKIGILKCSNPSFADGRMYFRTNNSVVCYDLAKAGK